MTVKSGSTAEDARIIQSFNKDESSKWVIEDLTIESPLKTGFYTIKNTHSQKYLAVYQKEESGYVAQHSNDHSDAKVWYVEQQEDGSYKMLNVDTYEYLSVRYCSFDPGSYLMVERDHDYSCQKWVLAKQPGDNTYMIKGLASGKRVGVKYNSTEEDMYIVLESAGMDSFNWVFEPVSYAVDLVLGGVYQFRHAYSAMYMSVLGESTETLAYLIGTKTGGTNASWWTLEQVNGGPFAIKNVKSQLYVTVEGRLDYDKQYIVQEPLGYGIGAWGHSLWHLWHSEVTAPRIYYVLSVFSGKALHIKDDGLTPDDYLVQQYIDMSVGTPDMRMRWILIPVADVGMRSVEDFSDVQNIPEVKTMEKNMEVNDLKISFIDKSLYASSTNKKIKRIDLVRIDGVIMRYLSVNNNNCQVDLSALNKGGYIIKISLEDNTHEVRKFFIR